VEQQPSSCICQGEVLEEPNVVGQVEIEHPNVHDLQEMDQFKPFQNLKVTKYCQIVVATKK